MKIEKEKGAVFIFLKLGRTNGTDTLSSALN